MFCGALPPFQKEKKNRKRFAIIFYCALTPAFMMITALLFSLQVMQVVREQIMRALTLKPNSLDQFKSRLQNLSYTEILKIRQSERMNQEDFQSRPILWVDQSISSLVLQWKCMCTQLCNKSLMHSQDCKLNYSDFIHASCRSDCFVRTNPTLITRGSNTSSVELKESRFWCQLQFSISSAAWSGLKWGHNSHLQKEPCSLISL